MSGGCKMAVRRQLQQFFQEPRLGGTILVERPRPETRFWCQEKQRAKTLAASSDGARTDGMPRLEEQLLFQCERCRTVLGDSLHLCAQEEKLGLVACLKVTNDVVVKDSVMVCVEGDLMGCTYNMLNCRSCELDIGIKLCCSTSLAHLRDFFSLFKNNIICYSFKTKTTVKASKIMFPTVSLKERVQKLKENLVLVHMRLEALYKKLEEQNQQRLEAKKHCYKPKPSSLAPGHRKKKLNN